MVAKRSFECSIIMLRCQVMMTDVELYKEKESSTVDNSRPSPHFCTLSVLSIKANTGLYILSQDS